MLCPNCIDYRSTDNDVCLCQKAACKASSYARIPDFWSSVTQLQRMVPNLILELMLSKRHMPQHAVFANLLKNIFEDASIDTLRTGFPASDSNKWMLQAVLQQALYEVSSFEV